MPTSRTSDTRTPRWASWSDEELLDLPMKRLRVKVGGDLLEGCLERLHAELAARGILFRPRIWVSEEFFSPRGVGGLAVPFFLCHPRLMRLEKKQMLEVEGGTKEWCMKILRHETGHAIQHAYELARRAGCRRVFGSTTLPYRNTYSPKPLSKDFVQHLGWWYAQSHPTEDFAETFAVWLRPSSKWRSSYSNWPAIEKLEQIDELMKGIAGKRPPNPKNSPQSTLAASTLTLREHYRRKRERYAVEDPTLPDRELLRLFSNEPAHGRRQAASVFLRLHQRELRERISKWTGQPQYTVDQVLNGIVLRCRSLKLRLRTSPAEARRDALVVVTAKVQGLLHHGQLLLTL